MIKVTKTYLPDLQEYIQYLEGIWDRSWITNHGPLVTELESKLKEYLGVRHLFFVSNGTIAIQIAIRALDLTNEIITTPFSYVATTSSIVWEHCVPVFVDIEEDSLCLDPNKIEAAITPNTQAILAVHVYGNPCKVEAIEYLATKHKLKVIYDAAHAFGVNYKGNSILNYGDISTLSFHATKLFHTVEGGAIITNNDLLAHKISYLRNFGHDGPEAFSGLGINGKNSELHAAMGLCVLPKVKDLINRRKEISELYDSALRASPVIKRPTTPQETIYNYAYYPILLESEKLLLKLKAVLEQEDILTRRYFYPSLHELPYLANNQQPLPIAESASSRALCLPLYPELTNQEVEHITDLVLSVTSKGSRVIVNS